MTETLRAAASKPAPSPIPPLVGAIALIVFSLGSIGYGLYELVFSGVATDRAQETLAEEFEARREVVGTTAAITTEAAAYLVEGFDDPDDVPVMVAAASEGGPDSLPIVIPDVIEEVAPASGEALGRIEIPKLDLEWVVVEGVAAGDLRRGPGHMPHTPLPGQPGNAVLSGHRTTNGAPFGDLDLLVAGDRLSVETLIGVHTYEVVGSRIVQPTDMWVTEQWDGAWLTLTTCNPKFSSRERLIVFAALVEGPNQEAIQTEVEPSYEMPSPA